MLEVLAEGVEQVVGATSLAPSLSSGVTTSVAAGKALVKGDTNSGQGFYLFECSAAETQAHTRDVTNPRVNMLVARVYDSTEVGSGSDSGAIEIVAGTPTAGANLTNRSGAASLPASALWIADVLVPVSGNATVGDRRPFGPRTSPDPEPRLKMIRGQVGSGGTIVEGSGFTVVRSSAGNYVVTWSTPFSNEPVVIPNLNGTGAGDAILISALVDQAQIWTYDGTNAVADRAFSFIAVGPA